MSSGYRENPQLLHFEGANLKGLSELTPTSARTMRVPTHSSPVLSASQPLQIPKHNHRGRKRRPHRWLSGELGALETIKRVLAIDVLDTENKSRLFKVLLPTRKKEEIQQMLEEPSPDMRADISSLNSHDSADFMLPSSSYQSRRISRTSKPKEELSGAMRRLIQAELKYEAREAEEKLRDETERQQFLERKQEALDAVLEDHYSPSLGAADRAPETGSSNVVTDLDRILGLGEEYERSPVGSFQDYPLAEDENEHVLLARRRIDNAIFNYEESSLGLNSKEAIKKSLDEILDLNGR